MKINICYVPHKRTVIVKGAQNVIEDENRLANDLFCNLSNEDATCFIKQELDNYFNIWG